jgi:MFS family permease
MDAQGLRRNNLSLDGLNFFLADVRDGLGPYLAIYLLAVHHWDPASIGVVMTVAAIAGLITQAPAGALIDRTRRTGRNETFNHAGNACAALLAGGFAWLFGPVAVFYLMAAMAVASVIAVSCVSAKAIDHDLARGLDAGHVQHGEQPWQRHLPCY